jgi:hypothetical protein
MTTLSFSLTDPALPPALARQIGVLRIVRMTLRAMGSLCLRKISSFLDAITLTDCSLTDAAFPASIGATQNVFRRVFMAVFAMGSFRPTIRRNMAMLFSRQHPQMGWIHAMPIFTDVMQIKTLWNWPIEQLVDKTMRPKGSIMASQQAVAEFVSARRPEPAFRCWINGNLFLNPLGE